MRDLIFVGAGDFSKEVRWIVERINAKEPTWNILGYVDDAIPAGTLKEGLPVLGSVVSLLQRSTDTDLVLSIANCRDKKNIAEMLKSNDKLQFPTIYDTNSVISNLANIREGVVVCAGSIIMPYAEIGAFSHINWNSTIGHDSIVGAYATVYPGCNISGKVILGICCEIGTGSKIIQGVQLLDGVTLGAGAVVVTNLLSKGTYVGVPAKLVK